VVVSAGSGALVDVDVLVVVARVVDRARERRQGHAASPLRAVGPRGELLRALADGRGERLRLRVSVDQPAGLQQLQPRDLRLGQRLLRLFGQHVEHLPAAHALGAGGDGEPMRELRAHLVGARPHRLAQPRHVRRQRQRLVLDQLTISRVLVAPRAHGVEDRAIVEVPGRAQGLDDALHLALDVRGEGGARLGDTLDEVV
jgi:hypothetical protein